jgi:hypothetical protein
MLRVDTERRFLPRFKKSGFGAVERINLQKVIIPRKEGLGHEKDFYGFGVIDFCIFTVCFRF